MRTSARVYVNKKSIAKGECGNSEKCALHVALARTVLKGKCFSVGCQGVYVGPNYYTVNKMLKPNLLFSKSAEEFVETFDAKGIKTKPTHVTIIDPKGKYL